MRRRKKRLHVAFEAARDSAEQEVSRQLEARYGSASTEQADVIVIIGGNSAVNNALHRFHGLGRPLFPMSLGYTGFLTNEFRLDDLCERIADAKPASLSPLQADWEAEDGKRGLSLAFNEVALYRQSRYMTHIRISVEGRPRLDELIGDGVLLATPAGSTAYNLSAQGPVLPLDAQLLALTPLAPFRPRRWRGALLPDQAHVEFDLIEADKRCASMTADFAEIRDVRNVNVRRRPDLAATLLFDAGHGLDERILREQFRS